MRTASRATGRGVHPRGIDPTTVSVDSRFASIYDQQSDFHEVMAEQLQRAPWFATSLLLNGLAVLFLYHFLATEVEPEEELVVQLQPIQEVPVIPPPPPDPKPKPEIEDIDPKPIEDVPDIVDNPQPAEAFSEHAAASDSAPRDTSSWNKALGINGPIGGRYGNRGSGGRGRPGGGGRPVNEAVRRGLKWLADHQDDDGKWDAEGFMKHDVPSEGPTCTGPGSPVHNVGVTALALLAFLADGNTLRGGEYQDEVKQAVRWLLTQQAPKSGLIGTNATHDFIYDHAIATYALVEAYGLSRSRMLAPVAQRAIYYLESHRNPYQVWRYQPQDKDNDTSVTGWCVMAYKSAEHFGLEINPNAMTLAASWLEQVTDPTTGRHGYSRAGELSSRQGADHAAEFPREKGEAMTAVGLFCRYFLEQDPKEHPAMDRAAELLLANAPSTDPGAIDHYYWYYASYALYQAGGTYWKRWQKHLIPTVVNPQRKDGNFKGSWDPNGVWGSDGGRVYSTALNVLTLQVHHRYSRIVR